MKKTEIENLFNNGRKVYTKTFKIIYLDSNESNIVISAPIKLFKRANKRNRVKRLIREAIREIDFTKKNMFIIYRLSEIKSLTEIKSELTGLKL